jgi:DNA repair protein RadC
MKYQIVSERSSKENYRISSPQDAYKVLERYKNKDQEHFFVLTLNGAHEVIKTHIISIGLANRTLVHPREVFRTAIKDNAVAVVLAHNHPSGNTDPSQDDREVTEIMKKAGKIIGIEVLDHMVFGKKGFYSFLEKGDL